MMRGNEVKVEKVEKVKGGSMECVVELVNKLLPPEENIKPTHSRLWSAKRKDGVMIIGSLTAVLCVKLSEIVDGGEK